MDVSETIIPNSEQVNAEDLLSGPRTVTITAVEAGSKEQPVFIHLAEFPERTYRPAKSMRRVLVFAWGPDSSTYIGRQLTIYRDPTVKFAGAEVGGIRISHLSHIPERLEVQLAVTRGKRAPFVVDPIPVELGEHLAALRASKTLPELQAVWKAVVAAGVASFPEVVAAKDARKAEIAEADK